jgi:PAS domain S-box-containing protein
MNGNHTIYLISIVISAVVMALIAWYALRKRDAVAGAGIYGWIAIVVSLISIFQGISMMGPTGAWAIFWFNLRIPCFALIPVLWLMFVFHYTGKPQALRKPRVALLFVVPVITQIILWTNGLHGLWVVRDVAFIREGPFFIPVTSARVPGPWYYVHILFNNGVFLAGLVALLLAAIRMEREDRNQAVLLVAGTLIMVVGALFPTFNLVPGMNMNILPQSFAVGSLIIAWGIFRHRFLISPPRIDRGKQVPTALIGLFALLAAGIIAVGIFNYLLYRNHHRSQIEAQLSSIIDLKVEDLDLWRRERLADGATLYGNAVFKGMVRSYFSEPDDTAARWRISSWLYNYQDSYKYDSILLLDARGVVRLAVKGKYSVIGEHLPRYINDARLSGKVIISDFHRGSADMPIHLSVIVPLVEGGVGAIPFGYIVMVIDPTVYLYPMLVRWPVPSRTAETLVVRKDGDDVLYLNELRFKKNTALVLRIPLKKTETPAVMAVLGKVGIVEGVDYRGVPVIAALRAVPGSPWFMVVRIDAEEVYAPVRARFWWMLVIVVFLVAGSGSGVMFLWSRQGELHLRERLAAVDALRESEERYRTLFDNMLNGFAHCKMIYKDGVPEDFVYLKVNTAFERLVGLACVTGKKVSEVIPGIQQLDPKLFEIYGRVASTGMAETFEIYLKSLKKWFSVSAYSIVRDELVAVFDVITERKRAEEALRTSHRFLQVAYRQHDMRRLLQEFVREIKSYTQCSAAGIRLLKEGGMIPYYEYIGFSRSFYEMESPLSIQTGKCMCINVIKGTTDPALPFYTDGGSFYMNGTTEFLATVSEEEKGETMNVCNQAGYESVAFIPIRMNNRIIGLIHVADEHEGMVPIETVEVLEREGMMLGTAIMRLQAEEELNSLTKRQEALLSAIPDIVMEVDTERRYTWANGPGKEFFGDDVVGREAADYFVGEQDTYELVRPLFDGDETTQYLESLQRRRDGEVRLLAWWCRVLKDEKGNVIGALSTARDITDRKMAENELRSVNERLRFLVDANIIGVVHVDENGAVREANDYYLDFLGYTRREFEAGLLNWRDRTPTGYLDADERAIAELRERGVCVPYEKEYFRKDGSRVWVYLIEAMLPDGSIAAYALDITARKRAENELRSANEILSYLNKIGQVLLTVRDEDMYFDMLEIIREALKSEFGVFGYLDERGDLVVPTMTRTIWDKCQVPDKTFIFPNATWGCSSWPKAIREKRIICLNETSTLTPPGHVAIYRHVSVPIVHQDRAIGLIQVANKKKDYTPEDVTLLETFRGTIAPVLDARLRAERLEAARRAAEEQIRQLNESLEQRVRERTAEFEEANRSLEAFSYSVSHDLRAPLRTIDGFSLAVLEDYADRLDEQGRDYLNRIRGASQRMSRLIDDLLRLSRIGQAEIAAEHVDLSAMAEEVARHLAEQDPDRQARVTVEKGLAAVGDKALLMVVLDNLIGNAWKFTSKRTDALIEFGETRREGGKVFFVRDNGIGFDMHYADKLFVPFQRLHGSDKFEGTGIGLAIVKRVVNRHGGRIWAEGETGRGACVYFTI